MPSRTGTSDGPAPHAPRCRISRLPHAHLLRAASKAAINRFTEALAAETRRHGVCVFSISPGTVKTNMTRVAFADDWNDPELWSPPELSAELVACIGSGALDDCTGRHIRAAVDDWRAMARN
jgi:NAD(P)-dependent dehydrogenase (short-subunit alcohol dehydrogenase family)